MDEFRASARIDCTVDKAHPLEITPPAPNHHQGETYADRSQATKHQVQNLTSATADVRDADDRSGRGERRKCSIQELRRLTSHLVPRD